jgi:hypothetical protein
MAGNGGSIVYEFNVLNLDSNKRMLLGVIVPLANFIFRFLVTNNLNLKPA